MMRSHSKTGARVLVVLAIAGFSSWVLGQNPPTIRDLTDRETVRAEELVEILTPTDLQPGDGALVEGTPVRTRGLGAVPDCAFYRESVRRGLGVRPVSDVAALEILFEVDSSRVSETGAERLRELAQALNAPRLAPCCFRLEGHADATGAQGYNLELSRRRANAVAELLSTELGVAADRLLTVGYGESRPLATNETREGRRRNRRVQIVNLGYGVPVSSE